MVPMSMTKTSVLFILVEAPPLIKLETKYPVLQPHQGSLLWHHSRVLIFSEATSEALLDLVYLLQLTLDTMLLTLGKLV